MDRDTQNYMEIKHNVYVQELWKHPVPTGDEVRQLLDLLPDFHPYKIALGIIATMGLRPTEVCKIKWNWWKKDKEGNFKGLQHLIYKPKNTINKHSISTTYKAIRKPIYSDWLNKQLQGYEKSSPRYENNLMFPFTTTDSLNKWFSKIRKENESPFLHDKIRVALTTASKTQYRISMYALRRFCISFLFHNPKYFNGDYVKLSRDYVGHSNVYTTLNHYILPKQAIGYDGKAVSIDQFIHLRGQFQELLDGYMPIRDIKLLPEQESLEWY